MKYQKNETFFKQFRELIVTLDFFGKSPEFYYKGNDQYKSLFGAILTITIIFSVIFMSFTMISSALLATNVDFRSDLGYIRYPKAIDYNFVDYKLAVTLDDLNHSFNRSVIGVRLQWTNQTRLLDGSVLKERKFIPMKPCKIENFKKFENEFIQYQLIRGLCPDEQVLQVYGDFLEEDFHYISVKVEQCNNLTHGISSIVCAPQSEIDSYFQKNPPKFQIYYKNTRVNPTQHTDSMLNEFIDNQFFYLDKNFLATKADIYLHDISIKSYTNFLDTTFYQTTVGSYAERAFQNTLYLTASQTELLSAVFRRGTNVLRYTRRYNNLGDVAARLGGIWGLIAGSVGIIATFYNKIGYQKNLGDTIFQYENINQINPTKNLKKKRKTVLKNEKIERQISTNTKYREFLNRAFNATSKAFKSPFHYLLASYLCCRRRNIKLKLNQQKTGLYLAKHKLDILFILRKLQEIEKLKFVLFDKNQRFLFDYIPPSYLTCSTNELKNEPKKVESLQSIKKSEVIDALKFLDPHNELQTYFRFKDTESIMEMYNIYKVMKKGVMNKRLISLLGFRVLSLFRYLDSSSSSDEQKEVKRKRGVERVLSYVRKKTQQIRERKKAEILDSRRDSTISMNEENFFPQITDSVARTLTINRLENQENNAPSLCKLSPSSILRFPSTMINGLSKNSLNET